MRSRLALGTVLAVLILGVLAQCQEARAIRVQEGSSNIIHLQGRDYGPSCNIQPVEECPLNLTLHTSHSFRNKFSFDYSTGSPDAGGQAHSDTSGMIHSAMPTIPEFPSMFVLLLFMVTTVLGVIMFKTRHAI